MAQVQEYKPDWQNEDTIAEWLGVDTSTLFRWRTKHKLAYTNINGRVVCYDRRQITDLLNKNSTYAISGDKKLTA